MDITIPTTVTITTTDIIIIAKLLNILFISKNKINNFVNIACKKLKIIRTFEHFKFVFSPFLMFSVLISINTIVLEKTWKYLILKMDMYNKTNIEKKTSDIYL